MKLTHTLPLAAATLLLAFSSCKREPVAPDSEYQSTLDHSMASAEFSSIDNLMDVEAGRDSLITGKTNGSGLYCPGSLITVVVLSPTSATLEVDFGTGCTCADGRLRTGKLTGTFVGKWYTPGSYVDIVPTDYTVNGNAVNFVKRTTYNGVNTSGHKNWTTVVTDGEIITTSGTITWETTRTTEFTEGDGDFDYTNNVYSVTGDANGRSRRGINFTAVTESPLIVRANCPNIVQGVLTLTPTGYAARSIDYGTGDCDNVATLSVGDWSTTITLY
jgi:uncharacterized membrane protein